MRELRRGFPSFSKQHQVRVAFYIHFGEGCFPEKRVFVNERGSLTVTIIASLSFQACVRRRAVLSVRANPACPDEATAERAVNEVWESCFNDTRPFDEVRRCLTSSEMNVDRTFHWQIY